jgi:DNA-binding CsgD family transcriptional regulator
MSISCIAYWLLLPLLVLLAVILWATETRTQRIRRWRSAGMTQKAIAQRLNCSVYQVRKALA